MVTDRIVTPTELRDVYHNVCDRITTAAERSGRRSGDVLMVAVTKNASPDQIRLLVEMGHADLGESRVQQLAQRAPQMSEFLARKKTLARAVPKHAQPLPAEVRWHMVGHLQRNKVKPVASLVKLIHSVDSLRLAEELHHFAARSDRTVDVLIQVNSAGETAKHGVAVPAVVHLAEQIATMIHLRFRGLMTMAPVFEAPEQARTVFARTAEIFHELRSEGIGGPECNILSMGMSDDFEIAIEEGANLVRIGRALFGDTEA